MSNVNIATIEGAKPSSTWTSWRILNLRSLIIEDNPAIVENTTIF